METITVKDSLQKEWECDIEVDNISVLINPHGYDRSWPLYLGMDSTFIENVTKRLNKLGLSNNYKVENRKSNNSIIFKLNNN